MPDKKLNGLRHGNSGLARRVKMDGQSAGGPFADIPDIVRPA